MATIVVVEDEPLVRELYVRTLRGAGHRVDGAADAYACRAIMRNEAVDVVILDLGLPGLDGLSLARELRVNSDIGLIIVSQRHHPDERVRALEAGCDDYLVKPVHLTELSARVSALLRRRSPRAQICAGALVIDLDARTAAVAGQPIQLTRGEFTILARLVSSQGKIVTRQFLCAQVSRSPDDMDIRTVDALIRRIRRKLEIAGITDLIATAPGLGYRLIT